MTDRHEIKFKTDRAEVTITTDDLSEISSIQWVRDLLGLSGENNDADAAAVQTVQQEDPRVDALAKQMGQIRKGLNALIERENQREQQAVRQAQQAAAKKQQSAAMEADDTQQPERQPASELQESAPEPPQSFMDVSPNEMNGDIWDQLSAEQKQAWQEKHVS